MTTAPPPTRSPLADPRVETLVAWAQKPELPLDDRAIAAVEALTDSLPSADAAAALALAAAAAYTRVPDRGPRDLQAGHRLVTLIGRLGESGARELVRLRERVHYQQPSKMIAKTLTELEHELGVPLGELEDAFGGPAVDAELTLRLPVGPFEALVTVSDDLRRVRTSWTGRSGKPVQNRPARAVDHPDQLALVQAERRRLQAHLTDLRARLEDAMFGERSWSVEQWVVRMFADPLRSSLARRLVWRFDAGDTPLLAIPRDQGLEDAAGRRAEIPRDANVELWHPAENPDLQQRWQRRATKLGLDQPIDQIRRDVILASPTLSRLDMASGARLDQRAFRGFLMNRGWHVPYLGPFFTVPEARRDLAPGGPIAVLHLEPGSDEDGRVVLGELAFESVQDRELDARELPPALVSEAARDVLGAVKAGT